MKFLDNEKLDSLCRFLSFESGDLRLETRLECYSCKMVNQDKRMFKEMLRANGPGTTANDLQALSPPVYDDSHSFLSSSPNASSTSRNNLSSGGSDQEDDSSLPVLCDAINRKRLFDLIAALNASFTDYDFSSVKSEHFSKVPSLEIVSRAIDDRLSPFVHSYSTFRTKLWTVLDDAIEFNDCKFYTYNPDYESDPYSEDGCVWSFNYFFYNPKLRRLLFFTCRAVSIHASSNNVQNSSTEWMMGEI